MLPRPFPRVSSSSAVIELLPACKNKKKHQERQNERPLRSKGVAMAITSIVIVIVSRQFAACL